MGIKIIINIIIMFTYNILYDSIPRMKHFNILFLIFTISACGKRGITFDLSNVNHNLPQYQELVQSEKTINEILTGKCLKYELNDIPLERDQLRYISEEFEIGIYNHLSGDGTGSYSGGKISLSWPAFASESLLVQILFHEIGHSLGYDHPPHGSPGFIDSIPERFGNAAQVCLDRMRQ